MYDRIIIGNDLSSLIAALASSRCGLRTVLVMEGEADLEYREAGYTFPFDPVPLSGLGQQQNFTRLLEGMGLPLDQAPRLVRLDPALQVILPDHRVDVFADRDEMIADMTREFPLLERRIDRFYDAVFKSGDLIERWIAEEETGTQHAIQRLIRWLLIGLPATVRRRMSLTLPRNVEAQGFRRVLEAQLHLFSHVDCGDGSLPLSATHLLTLPARNVFYPVGGRSAMLSWLRDKFVEGGGTLLKGCSIIRVDTEKGITVDLERSGEAASTLRAQKLIVSMQWEKLPFLLLQRKIFKRLVRRLRNIRVSAYPFCLHLGVREGGVSEKLAPTVILVRNESQAANGGSLVFIQTSLSGEIERAPRGKRAITATVFLKESPLVMDDLELKGIATEIMDSLEIFLPFLRESIDYVNVEKSIALSREYQECVNRKYVTKRGLLIGMSILSPKTPLSNVFLTGGLLRAGLGFEGEVLAGMDAAILAGGKGLGGD